MKKIIFLIFVVLVIAYTALYPDEVVEKKIQVTEGEKLEVNLKSGGAVKVTGWDKKVALVRILVKGEKKEKWDFKVLKTDSGVKVESRFLEKSGKSPGLEVFVPEKFDLELKTMGGKIVLRNIDGDISGRTMGGELDLENLKGEINLKTMGGDITLKDSDIDGKVKTFGGRVLLENVVGDIKGSSMGGNVVYKNVKPRNGKSTGKVVHISTMGGSINVSDAPEGADVHTMGGKIHIRSAKNFVSAKTMGGDIDIDDIDGWVKATTMGGNINVTMTGDPGKGKRDVKLSSMGGDISLSVPAGLSMDIDIELVFTKNSMGKYKIISDFDIEEKVSDKWDVGNGTPRKTIFGKATIKGGKNKIKIKTINGNIYLKKTK